MVFASRILLVFGLCLSKCSVLLITRQLFTRDKTKVWVTCNIGIGIVTACAIASGLAVSVACSPDHIIEQEENLHCGNDVSAYLPFYVEDVKIFHHSPLRLTSLE
jgi:hypothetical protein